MKNALQTYIENTARIRALSAPKLQDIADADEYSRILKDNFVTIGRIATENKRLLADYLFPFLEKDAVIDAAQEEALTNFGDSLLDTYNTDNLDPAILSLLSAQLLSREAGDDAEALIRRLDTEIIICYTMANITSRLKHAPEIAEGYRKRGFAAGDRMLSFLEKEAFAALSEDSRITVLINARYLWIICRNAPLSESECTRYLDALDRAAALSDDPDYRRLAGNYDWDYHLFRTYNYTLDLLIFQNVRAFSIEQCKRILPAATQMSDYLRSDPEKYGATCSATELAIITERARFVSGLQNKQAYRTKLLSLYEKRDTQDYSYAGMMSNMMIPLEYLLSLDMTYVTEEEQYLTDRLYHDILNYAFHMSGRESLSFMLEFLSEILWHFIELPGGMSFEEMCLSGLSALHPPTYVHSIMVGQLTRCLTRHLLRIEPARFDVLREVVGSDDIETFAYHAALCHDFGKLLIADTIMIYGRSLLDTEFGLLKQHPDAGAALMSRHESTKRYAAIARSHHRFYDDSAGYPPTTETAGLPEKVLIDLVTCADCLDAATDTVGRSYNRGKTLDEFIGELEEGAGTRYAPFLPALFADESVRRDITYLITTGRQSNYHRTYQRLRSLMEQSVLYGDLV